MNLPPPPPPPPTVVKATLSTWPKGPSLEVHFNPASLVYSVENSIAQQSTAPHKVQYVAQFSAKLTMDLQFDTTNTGSDVRTFTNQVAAFMEASGNAMAAAKNLNPPGANGVQKLPPKAPPVVQFKWGNYVFQGIMDSFKETIDFFSADGVALRALVSIGLSRQDKILDDEKSLKPTSNSVVPTSKKDSALSVTTRGGDKNAARQLGADNGLESLRFTGGASLQVSGGVQLNPPAAFVTPPSASADAGMSLGAAAVGGFGATFGATASAGVAATAGAFAGLQTGRASVSTTANLDPLQMLPVTVGTDVSTFDGASFSLGGAAISTGSAGLSTDVGAQFSFSDRLTFSSDD